MLNNTLNKKFNKLRYMKVTKIFDSIIDQQQAVKENKTCDKHSEIITNNRYGKTMQLSPLLFLQQM